MGIYEENPIVYQEPKEEEKLDLPLISPSKTDQIKPKAR